MKIKTISIRIGTGVVDCVATLNVTGIENQISFTLNELDLYSLAKERGEVEWSNSDVCELASRLLDTEVTE
jgi:putative ubiquitin-RnfH superfamily antitoxin RatB of RatAB toxin-antitoxin module